MTLFDILAASLYSRERGGERVVEGERGWREGVEKEIWDVPHTHLLIEQILFADEVTKRCHLVNVVRQQWVTILRVTEQTDSGVHGQHWAWSCTSCIQDDSNY